jgi:Predicted phage phi-C31 gp36 major capsid-like protein
LLNGNGTTQPTGILTADADVTTADNSTISFDEIISLYFSLKDEYRNNAVFIMHDNTAMLLRTLKIQAVVICGILRITPSSESL